MMSRKGYLMAFILMVIVLLVNVGLWLFGPVGLDNMVISFTVPIILGIFFLHRYLKFNDSKEHQKNKDE